MPYAKRTHTGELLIADTVEGPGFRLSPDDTTATIDGWTWHATAEDAIVALTPAPLGTLLARLADATSLLDIREAAAEAAAALRTVT